MLEPTLGAVVVTSLAAIGNGSTDAFVVGLALGVLVGLAAAPILRSWIVRSEWRRASREARLTDELLDRIERDAASDAASTDAGDRAPTRAPGASWQPSR